DGPLARAAVPPDGAELPKCHRVFSAARKSGSRVGNAGGDLKNFVANSVLNFVDRFVANFIESMLKLEDLSELLTANRDAAKARVAEFSIDGVRFDFNSRPAIMGVINLSAESWYRESVCLSAERAVERGTILHAQGA